MRSSFLLSPFMQHYVLRFEKLEGKMSGERIYICTICYVYVLYTINTICTIVYDVSSAPMRPQVRFCWTSTQTLTLDSGHLSAWTAALPTSKYAYFLCIIVMSKHH